MFARHRPLTHRGGRAAPSLILIASVFMTWGCASSSPPAVEVSHAIESANRECRLEREERVSLGRFKLSLLKPLVMLVGESDAAAILSEIDRVEVANYRVLVPGSCHGDAWVAGFSDDLTPSYEWVVMDNEAGLEHISRRTSTSIDTMLIVVTENPLSFHSALKIRDITDNMKERFFRRFIVTNMIRDKQSSLVFNKLPELGIEHIRDIPYDPQLEKVVFNGESVNKLEDGPAVESIEYILDRIQKS